MTRDELLGLLARLRQAPVGDVRAPHKPLLLLWLFGRFADVLKLQDPGNVGRDVFEAPHDHMKAAEKSR